MISYERPKGAGWKKEVQNNSISFSQVNRKNWCQITLYKMTASKGNADADFNSEWNELIAKNHSLISAPQKTDIKESDGWKIVSGTAKAMFNGSEMIIIHIVVSGYNNCISLITKTNNAAYLNQVERFNSSVRFNKPVVSNSVFLSGSPQNAGNTRFASTRWDDGWVSIAREDWVEVTKNDLRVLIHYPNAKADAYNSVLKDGLQSAWDILIAPRYSNMQHYKLKPVQGFESIGFAEADAIDKITGKQVHVVLFKKYYSSGNGRFLEFITGDKSSFEQEFGIYHNDEFGWDKPASMQYRNKFTVSAGDLTGKWSASDYASLTYYYVNGGGFAGATATSISQEFTFFNTGKYQSDQAGASGVAGHQKFSRQVYNGNYSVSDWEVELTNRFEGRREKYKCYFEAVKGGQLLILTDAQGTSYSLVRNIPAK